METSPQTNQEIEIKPMGSYFELDNEGYIINPTSLAKVQEEWKPLIEDIVEVYKKQYGNKLKNVYIRGSVAKGQAIKYVSDIDTLAYVDLTQEEITDEWLKETEKNLVEKFPFAERVELCVSPVSEILNDSALLNQSICVYGEPAPVPKMKPGREMFRHLHQIEEGMKRFDKRIEKAQTEEKIKKACSWLMKNFLRASFELVMERSQRYTRDLYLCYESFAEYYPEKEAEARELLH